MAKTYLWIINNWKITKYYLTHFYPTHIYLTQISHTHYMYAVSISVMIRFSIHSCLVFEYLTLDLLTLWPSQNEQQIFLVRHRGLNVRLQEHHLLRSCYKSEQNTTQEFHAFGIKHVICVYLLNPLETMDNSHKNHVFRILIWFWWFYFLCSLTRACLLTVR